MTFAQNDFQLFDRARFLSLERNRSGD